MGHNFPKMGFRYPNLSFFAEISTKTIKSLLQSFSGKVVAQSTISNGIYILAGDDPVPITFGLKGTDPQ